VSYIKNKSELIDHGFVKGREIVLDVVEHGIGAVDTYLATKRNIQLQGSKLYVHTIEYNLEDIKKIYFVGAGKGSFQIALALEEIFGERIEEGVVAVKEDETRQLKKIAVIHSGHPLPNRMSSIAAQEIVKIARKSQQGDLVFTAITGGASALMALPAQGIELKHVIQTTRLLLESGAVIQEINAVRKHISGISGGRLTQFIYPAEIINVTLMTNPKGMPWPDAIFADPSTFQDAIRVLTEYGIWDEIPSAVRAHLTRGLHDVSMETPKNLGNALVHTVNLGGKETACEGAARRTQELGINPVILSVNLEGEAREIGIALAGIAEEIFCSRRPFTSPCVLISGGETTVNLSNTKGDGGPNQELVLGFGKKISGLHNIAIASVGTDGSDGPTAIAGGIADGYTLIRAEEMGVDLFNSLRHHDSSSALVRLKDAVITGATGTNVMDLRVIFVDSEA
jgi:glycerate 2-kinase